MKITTKILATILAVICPLAFALNTTNAVGPLTLSVTTNGAVIAQQTFIVQSPQAIFSYSQITNALGTNTIIANLNVSATSSAPVISVHPQQTNASSDTYPAGYFPPATITITYTGQITNAPLNLVTNVQLQLQQ